MEHLSLFGTQIVQPILYNALTLLKTITVSKNTGNIYNLDTGLTWPAVLTSHLRGKKAELALNVVIDVVFLTGKAPHPAAKLWLDGLVHAHLLCSPQ